MDAEARRLVSFVRTLDPSTNPGAFSAIQASLEEVASEQKAIKSKLLALTTGADVPRIPTEAEIVAAVLDIESRLRFDPTAARERIRLMLLDGKITMTPLPDGVWQADSLLIVGRIGAGTPRPRGAGGSRAQGSEPDDGVNGAKTPKPRNREVSGASSEDLATGEVVEIGCCAGLQLDFPAQRDPALPPCWVPLETSVTIER